MVASIVLMFGLVKIFTGPVAQALGDRIRGRQLAEPDAAVLAELDQLRGRVAEMEERLDFAERLLAQARESDQLPGGAHR